jgi:UDP-N-acetylmuramate--alanine ligase
MYGRMRRIHFIGIGGSGMCGLAEVLLNLGYQVSGSDLRHNEATDRLATLGGRIFEGHAASNVEGAQVVVFSSAVPNDNVELQAARQTGVPVISRAEMLAELMRMKYGVAVGGTHGKTTTTSMVAAVLARGGLDPTVVVGGRLRALGSHAALGRGQFLVAEADESDGSFLRLAPAITVVTNIDREHLDYYRDLESIQESFIYFANRVPFYGASVLCLDDPHVRGILPKITKRTLLYGTRAEAQVRAEAIELRAHGSRYDAWSGGDPLGPVELVVPGRHNVLNSLAAVAVGLELEVGFAHIQEALGEFHGVGRRFETRGEARGVRWVDDYGHHPTEIEATLAAARGAAPGRVLVIFQPHRFTRTAALAREFGAAFHDADRVWVLDIYAAGETAIPGVTGATIAEAAREQGFAHVRHCGDAASAVEEALAEVRAGDLLLTLGAGDVWKLGEQAMRRLHGADAAAVAARGRE